MREKEVQLTKSFMNIHGKKKKELKVSWNEYIKKHYKQEKEKESSK